jgi:hypothetical protein
MQFSCGDDPNQNIKVAPPPMKVSGLLSKLTISILLLKMMARRGIECINVLKGRLHFNCMTEFELNSMF